MLNSIILPIRSIFFLAASLLLSLPLLAQTGQISGRVMDASGAAVQSASVVVRSETTGLERRVQTGEAGLYALPLLNADRYTLTASRTGFRSEIRSGVHLEVDQRAELNFTLEVGAVTESVEVTAAVSRLNTIEASQGQVVDNKRIVEMPLNGRNYIDLALMSGGAVQTPGNSRVGGFSAGGQRATQNNYLLDGIDNNQVELAAAGRRAEMVAPSIDALQEFKVQTNSYAAEFGRGMGGVVNVSLKNGTNDIHGSAFEFLRNEVFDARNFFTPPNTRKPPFKRNQYGLSLGGPVWIPKLYNGRNRTFFFGDFESTRVRETSTVQSTLPTMRMRQGDFGELPSTRRATDPTNGQPFANGIIPASRFDPVAAKLINLYPAPQNSGIGNNFINLPPVIEDVDKWDVRVDQNLSSNDNLFFRFSSQYVNMPDTPALPAPAFGGSNFDSFTQGYNTGIGWNHVFTPNVIGTMRIGWNYTSFARDNPASAKGRNFNREFGIPGATVDTDGMFTMMTITGYRALGIGPFNPVSRNSQNRQWAGDITWVRAKHTIKTGASLIWSQNPVFNSNTALGGYTFNSAYTRDGAADFLLGLGSQWLWQKPLNVSMRTYNYGFYVQDDFRVNQRLSLNFGLRYEQAAPWVEKRNLMGNFDIDTNPNQPRFILAKDGSRSDRALVATDKDNFMARIGFSFKITPKMVLRSGYGHFFAYLENFGDGQFLIGNPPFAYGVTLTGSSTVPAVILNQGPPAGATELSRATGLSFRSYQRYAQKPNAHQWNLNIQREFGADWLVEAGYSGSRGIHLVRQYDANFSPAGPGNIDQKRPYRSTTMETGSGTIAISPLGPIVSHRLDGNSIYHAMLAKVEKRFSNGFTLLASYTFSKTIGDTCGNASTGNTNACGYQNILNLRPERSLDNQDIPHRFVTSVLYDLPFGKNRAFLAGSNKVVDAMLGGWTVGSIVTLSSTLPFNVTVQGNPSNTGSTAVVQRPNVVGDPNEGTRTLDRAFNTDAFVRQPNFTYGNTGRNILRSPSHFNWDFSALKNFPLTEHLRLQFRFEAFTFTNTPRFGNPNAVLGSNTFGVIGGAGTPRNLQFALKLIW